MPPPCLAPTFPGGALGVPVSSPLTGGGGRRGLGSVVGGGAVVGGLLRWVVEQLLDALLLQDGRQLVVVEEVHHGVLQAGPAQGM